MSYSVVYSAQAKQDLFDSYEYIAFHLMNPQAAAAHYHTLAEAIQALDTLPQRHPLYEREPWKSYGLRKLSVKNYLVFYTVSAEAMQVETIRIVYAGMDLDAQLKE